VSTAEPWHVWLKYPELAKHVDFITIHLLPYWEGVPLKQAIDEVLRRYDEVRTAFPGKAVVIGEVGWPTNGDRVKRARPSTSAAAEFLRRFFAIAEARELDYYVMEAFDQPWKEAGEGRVGAYWGMFSANREPKFPLVGPVEPDPDWLAKAVDAGLLAFVPVLWFVLAFRRFHLTGRLMFAGLIQSASALLVWSIGVPFDYYLDPLDWAMLAMLLPAQLAILAILLANGFEFVEAIWNRGWQRAAAPAWRRIAPNGQSSRSISPPTTNRPRWSSRPSTPWRDSTIRPSRCWWSTTTPIARKPGARFRRAVRSSVRGSASLR
jgi:hypothetical protein